MYHKTLISICVLFFMLGFITCLNDILLPFLKDIFKLSYRQAAMIQLCFFGAYGLTSIPASKLIEKIGHQKGIVIGFLITAAGCLLFYPAVSMHKYGVFLGALFILASGLVMLQVAANPYVAQMGAKESASSRLSMVQGFNSLGTFIAPFFGSVFILANLKNTTTAAPVILPYVMIAVSLVLIAIVIACMDYPKVPVSHDHASWKNTLTNKRIIFGMLGIFLYVGAEVSIGSFLVNYVMEMNPMPATQAANLVALYWAGAMAGRFLGIFTLKEFPPGKVLMVHALLAFSLVLISINSRGLTAVYSMILVGLFNSIMFPTIYTLSLKGLKGSTHKAAGLLSTAILGGAIIPLMAGQMADSFGLRIAFTMPTICYLYIAILGFKHNRITE